MSTRTYSSSQVVFVVSRTASVGRVSPRVLHFTKIYCCQCALVTVTAACETKLLTWNITSKGLAIKYAVYSQSTYLKVNESGQTVSRDIFGYNWLRS